MFSKVSSNFLLILVFSGIFAENEETISVRIRNGLIDGKRENFDGRDFNVFLGIPYAQPPVGPLRFKKPVPVNNWFGTLIAKDWPNICRHLPMHQDYWHNYMSEDCLYLNIWTPIDYNSGDILKPVFFWIHGGGLAIGSSVEKFYQGQVLATKGDIVVVTINYRLDIFGFLYTGTDDAPGNMGFWDQALALEWVNDNIQYFGGDPTRITVAGESAGAFSTSMHILSPVTRHLFKNAVLMSGSIFSKIGLCTKESLLLKYKHYSQSIGCSEEENFQNSERFSQKQIDCIMNISTEQIEFQPMAPGIGCLIPILQDDHFMPDTPLKMLENKDFKRNFNVLIGTTEDEGSLTLPMGIAGSVFDKYSPPKNIDFVTAITMFKNVIKLYGYENDNELDKLARFYFTGLSNNSSNEKLLKAIGIGLGDFYLGCPTILFAKKLYEMDPKTNVFQYYFNSKAGADNKLFCAKWMGVCHFNDIYPLFGNPFINYEEYTERERQVSQEMMDFFSSFVKTGRPSKGSAPEWPQFYKIDDKIVAPFQEITDEPKLENYYGFGLKITECEYLWKNYITPDY